MTRRRVIFSNPESGRQYATPEFNGDKAEFEMFEMRDICTAAWEEITEIFRPVRSLEEFKAASEKAQNCYISSIAPDCDPLPIEEVEDPEALLADEYDEYLYIPL